MCPRLCAMAPDPVHYRPVQLWRTGPWYVALFNLSTGERIGHTTTSSRHEKREDAVLEANEYNKAHGWKLAE